MRRFFRLEQSAHVPRNTLMLDLGSHLRECTNAALTKVNFLNTKNKHLMIIIYHVYFAYHPHFTVKLALTDHLTMPCHIRPQTCKCIALPVQFSERLKCRRFTLFSFLVFDLSFFGEGKVY